MQIVVLLGFITVLMLTKAPAALPGRWQIVAAPVAYLLLVALLAWLKIRITLRNIDEGSAISLRVVRRYNFMGIVEQFWLVAGLAGVLAAGYGPWLRDTLRLDRVPLAWELAGVAPFVAALLVRWVIEYPFHRAVRRRIAEFDRRMGNAGPGVWTRSQYVAYNVRHHLLFIAVPICLIIAVTDALSLWVAPLLGRGPEADAALTGMTILAVGVIFFITPVMIVRIWRTRRLEDGPLRDELEKMCRSLHLRYRELLVWQSGGVIANAGVMGLAGAVRYVLLSDALLDGMDLRQVKAVFAHEAGHIAEHHIFYSVLFAIAAATFCMYAAAAAAVPFDLSANTGEMVVQGVGMTLLALTWGFAFGWLSRRFERQSDVIAAWACSEKSEGAPAGSDLDRITPEGTAAFASAMQRIAELNGVPLRQRNWRHGTIESRVRYVLSLGGAAGTRRDIDRTVRRIKISLWLATAGAVVLIGLDALWGLVRTAGR